VKAVILAGGRGTRLAPLTMIVPKPLVPIGHVPVLEVLLRQLGDQGFTEAILSVDYLADLIRAYVAQRSHLTKRMQVRTVQDEVPTGTAGPLAGIEGLDETFVVLNGDVLTTLDVRELVAAHRASGAILTVATHRRSVRVPLGVLETDDDGCVVEYREKPELFYRAAMGINVYEPAALAYLERGQRLDFPDLVRKLIDAGEKVYCHETDAFWLDMGTPDEYAKAQEEARVHLARYIDDEPGES
jgi:NDP-sugar pyrophosphorylase family protein